MEGQALLLEAAAVVGARVDAQPLHQPPPELACALEPNFEAGLDEMTHQPGVGAVCDQRGPVRCR